MKSLGHGGNSTFPTIPKTHFLITLWLLDSITDVLECCVASQQQSLTYYLGNSDSSRAFGQDLELPSLLGFIFAPLDLWRVLSNSCLVLLFLVFGSSCLASFSFETCEMGRHCGKNRIELSN